MQKARSGDIVRINYTGRLADGTQFDTSEGRGPLEFEVGSGQVISGLDARIQGMEVGARSTVSIPSGEAYGPRRPEAVQQVERSSVPDNVDLVVGAQLQARLPEGQVVPLTVVSVTEQVVELDANHPLAGEDLEFDVELVEIVRAA